MTSAAFAVRRLMVVMMLVLAICAGVRHALADEVADSIVRLRLLLKEGNFDDAALWMRELAELDDKRVAKVLVELSDHKSDKIAVGACALAAKRKE